MKTESGSWTTYNNSNTALFVLVVFRFEIFTRKLSLISALTFQYQRGRRPRGERWVLGLFDTQYVPARPYLQLVRRRNAATLLPIIQRKVQPGSLVYTDQWAAYRRMQRVLGFNHQTVNHSVNFVDPVTGVHTQHAEINWSVAKEKFKKMKGNTNPNFLFAN